MERADFTMLNNTNVPLVIANDTLYLAGVENWGLPPFPCFGKLAQALEEAKKIKKNTSNYKSYNTPKEMLVDVLGEDFDE